jgi:hypothetical protein
MRFCTPTTPTNVGVFLAEIGTDTDNTDIIS